jgi:hypothetical protein
MRLSLPATVSAAAVTIILAGCAGTREPAGDVASRTTSPGGDCFTVSLARDFRYLDDHNLIVYAAGREPYHVELSQACFGLGGDFQIGLRSRTGRMCGFGGEEVIVRGFGVPERCPVLSVRRLDDDQLQILVDQFNAGGRETAPIEVEEVDLPEGESDGAADADSGDDGTDER